MFLNGKKITQKMKKAISLPPDSSTKPLIIRFGHYYYDSTPLIGKVVDINIWDRWVLSARSTRRLDQIFQDID